MSTVTVSVQCNFARNCNLSKQFQKYLDPSFGIVFKGEKNSILQSKKYGNGLKKLLRDFQTKVHSGAGLETN